MIKWLYQSEEASKSGQGLNYPKIDKGMVWIFAVGPKDNELERMAKDFSLPSHALRNYTKERRSVRYSFEPFACTFVDYHLMEGAIERTNVLFFLSKNFIISILHKPIGTYESVFSELVKKAAKEKLSPLKILSEVLDADIEENYELLEHIENDLTAIEKEVATKGERKNIAKVVELKRTLNRMSRALWGSSRLTYFLKMGIASLKIPQLEMRRIDDLHESIIHQLDIISNYKESLTDVVTIYQTNISNWLATISNKINASIKLLTWVMLILTGLTLVITVPNTIATVFGIPYLPLSANSWMAIVALLVIATIIPTILFFYYWLYVKDKAREVEKQVE